MKSKFDKYYPGLGCQCMARHQGDCACSVDWTPAEVYELRERVKVLETEIKKLRNGNDVYFDPNTRNL